MTDKSFLELKNRSLFARLKKLFSDEVIIRNVGGKKLKVIDVHSIEYASDRSSLRDRFNRLRVSTTDNYSRDFNLAFQRNRVELFRDYDTMDMDPILHSALDLYADESTVLNEMGELIKVYSSNEDIHDSLDNLFNDILNVKYNLWSWVRSLCKYGDFYLRLYISPDYGVYAVKPYSAYNVTRIENSDLSNRNYVKFQVTIPEGNRMEELENYEMIHFRLISDSNFLPQGLSALEGARRAFKQLCLLEDSLLISQIMRAPEKRVFKIDVGNTPPNEIENLMNRISNQMTKTPYVDPVSGEYNLRYNMQNMIQDFFLPVRGNQTGTTIETLPGLQWDGINAVEYIRNKMMAALKIPKAFLGYEENSGERATLAQMDVRFARTIQRIQKFVLSGLTEIALVHLYSLGYRDEKLLDFELELANPSTIFEKEKLEIFKNKADLCQTMQEQKLFSKKWMYENIFGMSDQDIIELQKQLIDDSKANYRFSQIENEGSDPVLKFLKTQHKNYTETPETGSSDDLSSVSGLGSGSSFDDMSSDDEMFGSDEFGEEGEEGETGEETPKNDKEDKKNISETEKWKSPFNKHKNHNKMVQKKWDAERDQTGRKDASKYHFTEDPLGDVEMNRKTKNKIKMENTIINSMKKPENLTD